MSYKDLEKEQKVLQALTLTDGFKNRAYSDLPMFYDEPTKHYVRSSKIMVIFHSACSKRRHDVLLNLRLMYKSKAFVINDHPTEHISVSVVNQLKEKVKRAVDDAINLIVVYSSFSNLSLNRYCAALAHRSHYITLYIPSIKLPSGDWILSDAYLPLFSAWFMHDVDSHVLISHVSKSIMEVAELCSEFFNGMSAENIYPHNFESHYQLIFKGELKLCLAKMFRDKMDIKEYFEKSAVKKHYGKSAELEIIAFVITPHLVYARVKLNSQQKELFDLPEKSSDMPQYLSTLKKQSIKNLPKVNSKCHSLCCKQTLKLKSECDDALGMAVYPESGRFSQSHVILGYNEKAPVHCRNVEGALGAEMEARNAENEKFFEFFETNNFYVKNIENFWFLYLKKSLTVETLFTSCYKLK